MSKVEKTRYMSAWELVGLLTREGGKWSVLGGKNIKKITFPLPQIVFAEVREGIMEISLNNGKNFEIEPVLIRICSTVIDVFAISINKRGQEEQVLALQLERN